MFSGLMSRCTTPASCAAASAEATCAAISSAASQIHPPARERRAQSYAFDELGRDELPVSLRADLVNRQNVGMIQGRGTPRLVLEPAELHLVRRQALWEKLERGFASESFIPRQINLAHSANADERLDPVMTNQFSNQCAGGLASQELGSDFESR